MAQDIGLTKEAKWRKNPPVKVKNQLRKRTLYVTIERGKFRSLFHLLPTEKITDRCHLILIV